MIQLNANEECLPASISVVIPNYNGEKLFPRTLGPLLTALKNTQVEYEVIVVDDLSTDNSISFIKKNHPEIKILINTLNCGFSKTINKGILASRCELVLLLNSDIILTENYFHHLLPHFKDESVFGVMGRIVGWDDEIIQDAARYPEMHLFKIKTSCNYRSHSSSILPTIYLSGANALVRRNKLLQLRGFDELFSPFYVEDCDLSFRAWRMGWKCTYEDKAICRHRTSSSIKAKSKKNYVDLIYNRNKYFLHAIHLPAWSLPIYFLQVLIEVLVKLLVLKPTLLRSFWLFLTTPGWIKSRKNFRKLQSENKVNIGTFQAFNYIRKESGTDVTKFRSGER